MMNPTWENRVSETKGRAATLEGNIKKLNIAMIKLFSLKMHHGDTLLGSCLPTYQHYTERKGFGFLNWGTVGAKISCFLFFTINVPRFVSIFHSNLQISQQLNSMSSTYSQIRDQMNGDCPFLLSFFLTHDAF